MMGVRSSSLRGHCGTWSAYCATITTSLMRKTIPAIECFGVFSKVIAFACIESRSAAARTILPERRRAAVGATLARPRGEPSPAEFARPMSRRQITDTGHTADPPPVELVAANGLFASLVFHQVRLRNHSADAVQRSGSHRDSNPGPVSVADVRAQFNMRSGRPVTIAQTGSLDQVSGPIEALFTELAARRLRSLAGRERT